MPGYVIHLTIAKEYIKKHKIDNRIEFLKGTIAPDGNKNKVESHYSIHGTSSGANLYLYLKDNKLDNDYNKGYFLHLLADLLFYNKYFRFIEEDRLDIDEIHRDYDRINKYMLEEFDFKEDEIELIQNKYWIVENEEPKYLKIDKINEFIDIVSNYDIDSLANNVIQMKENYMQIFGVDYYEG
jgi:hypothetical protein